MSDQFLSEMMDFVQLSVKNKTVLMESLIRFMMLSRMALRIKIKN